MPGRVVDFTINGFGSDERSGFPFEFVENSFYDPLRNISLTHARAQRWIHNVRSVQIEIDIAAGGFTTVHSIGSTRDIPNEASIQELFCDTGNWPTWSPVDIFGGLATICPLDYSGPGAFGLYMSFSANVEDPAPAGGIVNYASTHPITEDDVVSGVIATFWGESFIMYSAPPTPPFSAPPVTGTVTVEPSLWWSYGGRFNTSTGDPI